MPQTSQDASVYLHHLHFFTPDPEALSRWYGRVMSMDVELLCEGVWLAKGPGRRVLFSKGSARTLAHAGFAIRDADALKELCERARRMNVATTCVDTPLFQPDAFSVTDPDGNAIHFGVPLPQPAEGGKLLHGPIQHLTLATQNVVALEEFYVQKLGFLVSDRVVNRQGKVMTSFMRSNHEHHNLACFFQDRQGVDHHSYEAGEWNAIRDWADHLAAEGLQLFWGPGRHGPGNNLFIFIKDPDENWIEISAELEVIHDRPVRTWPHEERTLNLWGRGVLRA